LKKQEESGCKVVGEALWLNLRLSSLRKL